MKGENMFTNFEDMPMALSVTQAAEVLGIAPTSLYKLIENDKSFPVLFIGRRKSIPKEELREWINKNCFRN